MRLPGYDRAVLGPAKLRDYCLDPNHLRGKHKARVFRAALGLTAADWEQLRDAILAAIEVEDAHRSESDQYGQRYFVDFEMTTTMGRARIRTTWIVLRLEQP